MEQRRYDISHYGDIEHIVHKSLANFLESQPTDGVHSFSVNGRKIDILIESKGRNLDTTLVSFPAAVPASVETYPFFNGRKVAAKVNARLVAFADPALGVSRTVLTGWTLGDSTYRFHEDVPKIISHVSGNSRKIFLGISAGGFPALYFGSKFQDSLSFVVNPRTSIMNPPSHVFAAAAYLYPNLDGYQIADTIPIELGRAKNTVFYVQNQPDFKYVSAHMIPFMNKNLGSENVYWKFGNWGPGHKRMPDTELIDAITVFFGASIWKDGVSDAHGTKFTDLETLFAEYGTLRLASNG